MRMILVHGISQEGKSEKIILDEWLTPLRAALAKQGSDPIGRLSRIEAVFYGDLLGSNSSPWLKSETLPMGAEEASDDFDDFAVEALEAMAISIGVTRAEIEAEAADTTVPMGKGPHKKWLKAIARAVEKISPLKGAMALRVLGEAHAYIRNKYVHNLVNNNIRPVFEDDEPAIIISHSLGTVVSYALLREFERNNRSRQSPLWLTLGSPLGIDVVRKSFTKPRIRPSGVSRWVNAADPEDFVALHSALSAPDFGPDIENFSDVENGPENPHGIAGYLSDVRVAKAIIEAIP
ncbi:hypothetical protein [Pseudooceanicola spongiae]|uniref:Serine peptidase n=1 Tax=Pseudooceanicola spongiae TaxID=2613965 RepID=A0A7L9WL41_9RHOB|nr:hypothetical protein [Pseudooceanicola spongiae]QOL81111.1 hypothetical protein F3W81_09990 [Pseudooceanicola spongiae]